MVEEFDLLAQRLGLDFCDRSLLFQSLVHRSYLNENPGTRLRSNERLEFLGDAVLDALAAEFLFQRCPEMGEGELTLWRSALVRTETLADFAAQFDLGRYLVMGRGEEADGGRTRTTILADSFEAVLGAVYLDGGLEVARAFLTPFFERALEGFAGRLPVDYKSALQMAAQGKLGITPQYRTAAAWGPDHARMFQIEVWVGERLLGRGEGLSKQAAQQEAAREALAQLSAGHVSAGATAATPEETEAGQVKECRAPDGEAEEEHLAAEEAAEPEKPRRAIPKKPARPRKKAGKEAEPAAPSRRRRQ